MSRPSPIADPTVLYLTQVLEQLRDGSLAIPKFQRPLVWKPEQQLDLLRSIRDGIPMGALLVWTTDLDELRTVTGIGGIPLQPSKSPRRYLLDGLQRMTTLFSALADTPTPDMLGDASESKPSGDAPYQPVIRFDLQDDDFVFAARDDERPSLLPLSILEDGRRLLAFQRRLGEEHDEWIAISDTLARAFREYKVAVINIQTNDLEAATRTFQKANSGGTHMSEAHMLHALVSSRIDLRDEIESRRESVLDPIHWNAVDDDVILRVSKGLAGLDIYEATAEQLTKEMSTQLLDRTFLALERSAGYLESIADIRNFGLVPYSMQAVLLAMGLDKNPQPPPALATWFWQTTYAGVFAGMSGYRTQRAVQQILDIVEDGELRWPGVRPYERAPLPQRFDFRAARARALALMLAKRGGTAAMDLLHSEGKYALRDLIARKDAGNELHASPGNRVVADPEDLQKLRHDLRSGTLSEADMQRHVISHEALDAIRDGRPADFIRQRVADLAAQEDEFLRDRGA